jgi:hypothetical protein
MVQPIVQEIRTGRVEEIPTPELEKLLTDRGIQIVTH